MATTTEPTTSQKVLMCRLRRHVITDDGDFIPAATPVQVLGWIGNHEGGPGATDASRVEVRASVYMYAETFDYDARTSAVGVGLCLSVEPSDLEFMSITDA